jgi:hypothetical protein
MIPKEHIFSITSDDEFNSVALDVFRYQAEAVPIYRDFISHLKIAPGSVQHYRQIPFLPIRFFKTHDVLAADRACEVIFTSSGTTGQTTSKHKVESLDFYIENTIRIFSRLYGHPKEWCILALLPSYLERSGSSLIAMTKAFIELGSGGGFYLNNFDELSAQLVANEKIQRKTMLLGVTFGLLDFAAAHPMPLCNTTIMETGGMKGRKEELTREEVHDRLKKAFSVSQVHSEYGMTELLSQAYAQKNGLFECPPWMKVLTRDTTDPLNWAEEGKTGGINIIDLANWHSCAFIATEDLGKVYSNGSFEVLGRFDQSEARGCNLMAL